MTPTKSLSSNPFLVYCIAACGRPLRALPRCGWPERQPQGMDVGTGSAPQVADGGVPVEDEGAVAVRRRQRPEAQWALHQTLFFPTGVPAPPPPKRRMVPTSPRFVSS